MTRAQYAAIRRHLADGLAGLDSAAAIARDSGDESTADEIKRHADAVANLYTWFSAHRGA